MIPKFVTPLSWEKSLEAFPEIDAFLDGSSGTPGFLELFLKDQLSVAKGERDEGHPARKIWGAALERDSLYGYRSRIRLKKMAVQGLYYAHFNLAAASLDSGAEKVGKG